MKFAEFVAKDREGKMHGARGWPLWLRWVGANAVAELLGLGSTFAVGIAIFTRTGEPEGFWPALLSILLFTSSGAIEGVVVGLLQWSVLRGPFPQISRRSWMLATLVGALVAWFLGSLPSTLLGMGAQEAGATPQEPETWVVLLLAAAMGAVLGVVLSLPQWRVLRRAADGAWLWIPANCAAWALGMPTVFAAVDLAYRTGSTAGALITMAIALALTGAIVGAVHGLALVRLASQGRAPSGSI